MVKKKLLKFYKQIRQFLFAIRVKKYINKANKWAAHTKQRYLVILVGKKLVVISRKELKSRIKHHSIRKGTTIEMIERKAIYITA